MFMFYEVALIPMYLLIGVWGSGKERICSDEAYPDADGRICLPADRYSWESSMEPAVNTMNILEIAATADPDRNAAHLLPDDILSVSAYLGALFPIPYMEP